jgi:uncharacterized DUF497 family protein
MITYHENKRWTNIEKHGYDFTDLDLEFFARSVVIAAKGNRLMAVGILRNNAIVVVFITLGSEGLSVISMRRASRRERKVL